MTDDGVQILYADDEEADRLLLERALNGRYRVATVASGEAALRWMEEHGAPDVVISDMYMGRMDGIALLVQVQRRWPGAVGVLFTRHADLDVALAAVNEGHVFQLITKDWPTPRIIAAADAAVRQAELLRSERDLLERTLTGAINALGEALALANPIALGHTLRLRRRVPQIARRMQMEELWELEVATQLSQLGTVPIPPGVLERLLHGRALKDWEQTLIDEAPIKAANLLAEIPRLDRVQEIIRLQNARFDGEDALGEERGGLPLPLGARILRVAIALDRLEVRGHTAEAALAMISEDRGAYDPAVLKVVHELLEDARQHPGYHRERLPITRLVAGYVFAEDVYTRRGLLLVSRGSEATSQILERVRGFSMAHGVREPIEMLVPND